MASSILYEGPSELDGSPIVVIATDNSNNRKTGGMVQTWIMRADVEPHKALKTGQDASVCGDCPHRPIKGGACYVTVFQAPLAVYRAYHRGIYPAFQPAQYEGRDVRIGSYGDPAAVPLWVWAQYVEGATGITGYTHQWKHASATGLGRYCMASVDTHRQKLEASWGGWRTFRVRTSHEFTMPGEVICPASKEGGEKLTCNQCKACNGNFAGRRGGIVIIAHGAASKVKAFERAQYQLVTGENA